MAELKIMMDYSFTLLKIHSQNTNVTFVGRLYLRGNKTIPGHTVISAKFTMHVLLLDVFTKKKKE